MVEERRKEVQKASTSKGAESPIGDTICDGSENESSSDSEGLNYGGLTEEETKALKSMINRQELEELKKGGVMSDSRNEMETYRDFMACNVPKFDGMLDPIACTKWLSAVEGAFRTSSCKEKNKVNFASNFLRDSAKMWWEGKICEKGKEWIDRDAKTPKQDKSRKLGTLSKTPCKKCHKTHLGVCRANFPGCYKCGALNHMSKDCKKPMILCYNCNQLGHISNECLNPKAIEAKPLKSIKEEKVEKTGIPTPTL
ncbi:zinc finger, CCHC-type, retrotransposon gag domain protein [Tanacetum coccineum]